MMALKGNSYKLSRGNPGTVLRAHGWRGFLMSAADLKAVTNSFNSSEPGSRGKLLVLNFYLLFLILLLFRLGGYFTCGPHPT